MKLMRFLIDAQLPPAMAAWLGEHGLGAKPVRDLGLRDSDDGSIWNFVKTGDWVLITKDEDFVARWIGERSAITGRFVKDGTVKERPNTTVRERIPLPGHGDTGRGGR